MRPLSEKAAVPLLVMPETMVTEPYTVVAVVLAQAGLSEPKFVQVIFLPARGISKVTVNPVPENEEPSNVALSCGKGVRPSAAPPDEVDHSPAVDQLPVSPIQKFSSAVVNVIPEFPPILPDKPVIAEASKAVPSVISL